MFLKTFYFALILLFTFTSQLNLIPDNTNALMVELPNTSLLSTFQIKFSFPTSSSTDLGSKANGSPGLTYNQFIGVVFPNQITNQLTVDPDWACSLTDGTYEYQMQAVPSAPGTIFNSNTENNVAYCQLIDTSSNVPLATTPGITYTIRISLKNQLSTNILNGISLFTSTVNSPEKIIIDSLVNLGSAVIYNDWTTYTPKPLQITTSSITITTGLTAGTTIYPNSYFNINLTIQINSFITQNDHLIVINYPSNTVLPATSVKSTAAAQNDLTKTALQGTLSLEQFGTNSLLVTGISEDLVPGRQFVLSVNGFSAMETNTGNAVEIEVYVYYKNTYSVLSYDSQSITVAQDQLTITANHPEFWDIYSNAAWPVTFTFATQVDYAENDGYYIVIRQTSASDTGGNLVTFVSSTCDFSANTSFDNTFGNRPSCFPLRLDNHYPGTGTSAYNGSGIFFRLNGPISASQPFTVTVWVFADLCGIDYNNASGTAFSIPNFEVSLHKNIVTNLLNENRFNFQLALGIGTQTFNGKCWNNKIQSFTVAGGESINTGDDNFRSDLSDNLATPSLTLRFKEIYSWRIASQTTSTCTNCYAADISATALTEQYIYSSTNMMTSSSYFLAQADLNLAASTNLSRGLPGMTSNAGILPGFLTVQFSKNWFSGTNNFQFASTNKCYLSWALKDPPASGALNSKTLSIDITSAGSSSLKNYIGGQRGTTSTASEFDETKSNLVMVANSANSLANIMKLVTKSNLADGNETWDYFPDEVPANAVTNVSWFTDCLTWNPSNPIKSLFTYIDIQFIWTYSASTNTGIFSNTRLIKLFPEGGVFQDKVSKVSGGGSMNPYVNHVVLADNSDDYSPVCLVELSGSALSSISSSDTTSGVFALWLGFGVLLETDYSNTSTTYPVGPLVSTAVSYGLQSQIPMHFDNLYVSDNYTNENAPLYAVLSQLQNPSVFGGSSGQPLKGENTSSYHFLMGSLLLITGLSNGILQSSASPVFIPYYCPFAYPGTNTSTRQYLNFGPSIFGTWLSMTSHSNISNVNRYLYYGTNTNGVITDKMSIILSSNPTQSMTIKTGPYKGQNDSSASNISKTIQYTATLRWNAYTDVNDNVLNVFNGNRDSTNVKVTCTGFSVFFNLSSISLSTGISFSALTGGALGYYNSSYLFYVMGKPFTAAVFWGGLTAGADATLSNILPQSPTQSTNSMTISGVKRPTLASFQNSKGDLIVSDKVAFSCAPAQSDAYDALTNYFYDSPNSQFVLDWTPSTAQTWTVNISFDNSNDIALNDVAGNVNLQITTPAEISSGSEIQIGSTSFSANTVCGIVSNIYSKDCLVASSTASCIAPSMGTQFNICCYNINVGSTIQISSLSTNIQTEPNNGSISKYLIGAGVYDASAQISANPMSFTTNNANSPDIINNDYATISAVTYSQNNQVGGIGKITFTIQLPREPARAMALSIAGHFDPLFIMNINTRCLATFNQGNAFGSNWDAGDALIDACAFANPSQLVINTKNNLYKCGISFSKTLYVSLWPVVIVDWADISVNSKFTLSMTVNSIAIALTGSTSISSSVTSAAPAFVGQWKSLCATSSISPGLPGEIGEYTFEIDLDTNQSSITGSKPNEVTIFWDYSLYGPYIDNIYCYSNGLLLNCDFEDEGILNIKFPTNLPIGSGQTIPITIVNVPNPMSDTLSFLCTVNNINFTTGTRTNIITGSGIVYDGISYKSIQRSGNLRFYSVTTPVLNNNPRELSTHTFRIAFDSAVGQTQLPVTIENTPVFHIYFPTDYNFAWYPFEPTASILVYTSDSNNIISKTQTYFPETVVKSGNTITLTLSQAIITIDNSFQYADIVLSNIMNPSDNTLQLTAPYSVSSRPYLISITNIDESAFYKTFTNVNTYATDTMTDSSFNLIQWNRGNIFAYDNTKWVVDIKSADDKLNKLKVKTGRYSPAKIIVRQNNNVIFPHANTTIFLNNNIFNTSHIAYGAASAIMEPINFLVGCPCGTAPGYYIVNFNSTDTTMFEQLSPVIIAVDASSPSVISFTAPSATPIAGTSWIPITISDYNFDPLNVKWVPLINSQNDVTASITNVIFNPAVDVSLTNFIEYSQFSITSSSLSPQIFVTSDPNACYTFKGLTSLSIAISGQVAVIPSTLQFSSSFTYSDPTIDNTITDLSSIQFTFTPPIAPIYLYCALACYSSAYPGDAVIIAPSMNNTNLLQFYSNLFVNTNAAQIVFSNLVRGQQYKMRCIIESTQADPTLRTSTSNNIVNPVITGSSPQATSNIMPMATTPTQCVQWNFLSDPGVDVKDAILNYCQSIFSASGWLSNGCTICTTPDATVHVPGIQYPTNITCTSPTSSLRFMQTPLTTDTSTASVSNPLVFSVCPVPSPLCKTDLAASTFSGFLTLTLTSTQYASLLNTLITTLNTPALFSQTLNIPNVPLSTTSPTTVYSDSTALDITTLKVTINSYNINGSVSMTATIPTPAMCYWQIISSLAATTPTYSALKACNTAWCGSVQLGATPVTFTTNPNNLQAFAGTTAYNIFFVCSNNVAFAQNISSVKNEGSFTTPASSGATYITGSILTLIMIIALLFN